MSDNANMDAILNVMLEISKYVLGPVAGAIAGYLFGCW